MEPRGQMHMYPPCPVSMQVALPAQGLDAHRRVSVGNKLKISQQKKVFSCCTFSLLLLSCSCACFLFLPPFPSSRSCSHHSILSPRGKLRSRLAQASSSSAPAEEKRRCLHTEVNSSSINMLCSMRHNSLLFQKLVHYMVLHLLMSVFFK